MKKTIAFILAFVLVFASFSVCAMADESQIERIVSVSSPDAVENVACKEEIRINTTGNITSLDPNTVWSYQANEVFRLVFDTLLRYNNGEYGPRLATAWEWNEDSTVIKVTLRDDVFFTNGEKMTAEDVAFSLDRCTYGSVANYYDHSNIISDTEMEIVLGKPCSEFLYFLADTSTGVVCKKAVEEDAEWGFIIGTGPYMIDRDSYIPGVSISVVRNEKYWGAVPPTARFTFIIITDASAALVALQNDEINWVVNIPDTEIEYAREDENIEVLQYDCTSIQYLAFNTVNGGNLVDKNLRKAVAYAIDKELIAIAAGQEGAKIADTMWSWCAPGFFTDFEDTYSYDPEKAAEYVAMVDDPSFTIMCNGTYAVQKNIALMVQEMCNEVGMNVSIIETDPAGISSSTKWGSASHEMLVYNISLSDSNTSVWDFYTVNATKNRAFCSDERVQELLALAAASEDSAAYYAEIQSINNEDIYYIPLFYLINALGYTKGLTNVGIRMSGGMDFTYAYIPA